MVDLNGRLERIEAKLELLLAEKVQREFYTIEQAAEVLGLANWTVRNRCRLGDINAEKKRNGKWLIPQSEITRLQNNSERISTC